MQMTIADFAVVALVSTIDMIVPVTVESWPKLYGWWYNMKQLPYYDKVSTANLNKTKLIMQSFTDFKINFE